METGEQTCPLGIRRRRWEGFFLTVERTSPSCHSSLTGTRLRFCGTLQSWRWKVSRWGDASTSEASVSVARTLTGAVGSCVNVMVTFTASPPSLTTASLPERRNGAFSNPPVFSAAPSRASAAGRIHDSVFIDTTPDHSQPPSARAAIALDSPGTVSRLKTPTARRTLHTSSTRSVRSHAHRAAGVGAIKPGIKTRILRRTQPTTRIVSRRKRGNARELTPAEPCVSDPVEVRNTRC